MHAGRSVVSVDSTCTDQVARVGPRSCPIDTETLIRATFKDGSIHNTHERLPPIRVRGDLTGSRRLRLIHFRIHVCPTGTNSYLSACCMTLVGVILHQKMRRCLPAYFLQAHQTWNHTLGNVIGWMLMVRIWHEILILIVPR